MKLFLPILFLAISGTVFFFYIDPTYAKVKDLLAEQGQIDQALTRSKELQDVRDSLLARYNTFPTEEINRLQRLIPDHVDNVRLILDLDSMAAKYGMRVRDVNIGSQSTQQDPTAIGADDSAYESVVLSFTVSGTYDTFRQFLGDLERSLRLVDIVGLTFKASESGIYNFTFHIKTYWLKP